MRSFKAKYIIKAIAFLLVFIIIAYAFSFALTPAESFTRLSLHEFYGQEDIDMLFLGASHPLHGIDPKIIDEKLEVNSFNLASASQKAMDSYFLLKEAYSVYSPDTVLIEITYGMYTEFSGYDNPLSSMIIYDHMRNSGNRFEYFQTAFTTEDWANVLLPAYRYRDNLKWETVSNNISKKLTPEYSAYDYAAGSYDDEIYSGKGFVRNLNAVAEGNVGQVSPYKWDNTVINHEEIKYLEKMIELSKENGSNIILFSAPIPKASLLAMGNYDETHAYFSELAEKHGVVYYDFNLIRDEYFERADSYYYDSNHLNAEGAEHFSKLLADILKNAGAGNNISAYFYNSFSQMDADMDTVESVYLQIHKNGNTADISARALAGSNVEPEYRIVLKIQGKEDIILCDYGEEPEARYEISNAEQREIWVFARPAGTDEYVQWDMQVL